ncbi:hypothetical protein J6T66_00995 [bacterium]|nr:hypothetical protein [bacterium]
MPPFGKGGGRRPVGYIKVKIFISPFYSPLPKGDLFYCLARTTYST